MEAHFVVSSGYTLIFSACSYLAKRSSLFFISALLFLCMGSGRGGRGGGGGGGVTINESTCISLCYVALLNKRTFDCKNGTPSYI